MAVPQGEPLPGWFYSDDAGTLGLREPLTTVAECDRIVGAVLRQKHEADTALAWATRHYQTVEQQRDAALARVDALAVQVLKLGGTISFAHYPAAQAGQVPEVSGIGRDTGHPRAVVLYLHKEPTDDDLRAIQDGLRSLAAAPGKEVPQAWLDVQAERRRQITAEGWTPDHDDLYCAAELPRAAAAYILSGANDEAPAIWPFSAKWWKPRDARANYMRAGALILAEIERLDRAAAAGKEVGHE
ncbi:hypothetical protein ACRCQG_18170 [Pseudomonas aeruginosa]